MGGTLVAALALAALSAMQPAVMAVPTRLLFAPQDVDPYCIAACPFVYKGKGKMTIQACSDQGDYPHIAFCADEREASGAWQYSACAAAPSGANACYTNTTETTKASVGNCGVALWTSNDCSGKSKTWQAVMPGFGNGVLNVNYNSYKVYCAVPEKL